MSDNKHDSTINNLAVSKQIIDAHWFRSIARSYVEILILVPRTKQTIKTNYQILRIQCNTTPHSRGKANNGAPRWRRQSRHFACDSPLRFVSLRAIPPQVDCWVQGLAFLRRAVLCRRWGGGVGAPWDSQGEKVIFVLEKFLDQLSKDDSTHLPCAVLFFSCFLHFCGGFGSPWSLVLVGNVCFFSL